MYRSVIVPLDGSPFSEYSIPYACAIAHRAGALIRLIHVHVPADGIPVDGLPRVELRHEQERREYERSYLDRIKQQLSDETNQPSTVTLLDGPVDDALIKEIESSDADLVVMTTHGRGGLTRLWLGSIADRLMHRIAVPLLLLRPHDSAPARPVFRKILVPLDGSHLAEQIIARVQELDPSQEAEIILLQVVHPYVSPSYHAATALPNLEYDMTMYRQEAAQDYLASVARRLRLAGWQAQPRIVIEEQTAMVILHEAHDARADLIALATHGRGGPARLLLGSIADKVIRGTECPVLVFRPTGGDDNAFDAATNNPT